MVDAPIVPNLGTVICHALRISSNRASMLWSTLSSSSTRPEGGLSVHKVAVSYLPTLFHRSHFDWATGFLFVLEVRRQQTTPRPGCQYTTSFAGCSLSLFHRSHFDWVMESVLCSEAESHQISPLGRRSSVAKSFSPIAF